MTTLLLLLFITRLLWTADAAEYLISGIADTAQVFSNGSVDLTRHHLVCFRHDVYQTSFDPETCCSQLYLKGSIEKDQVKYCLDHVAEVSSIESYGSVSPAYYLAIDSSVTLDSYHEKQLFLDNISSYRQHRSLQVVEDKEKETLLDGYKGVDAFSPFHLTGFMPSGLHDEDTERSSFPLFGIAEGSLSNEGGMHRSFGQTVHFSFLDLPNNNDARYRMKLSATVLLPITESVFIDADDPLIVEYTKDSPDGIKCRAKFASKGASALDTSTLENDCNIQFTTSEVIDIEQPSFASRQYVVVYHISASLDFDYCHHEGTEGFELLIDYGTTLHIRYPSPILNQTGVFEVGIVPIVIQQPVLYSTMANVQCLTLDCSFDRKYILQTDVSASEFGTNKALDMPEPVLINVAAGINADYWWVTLITMSAAVVGGIVVIKSIDSVSQWS
eukprot:scaffold9736_cov144-Skeletonema_marinoi.AAC.19